MRGRMMMVLASAALAGSLLATDAQARGGGGHGGGGGGDHMGGFGGAHMGGFDGGHMAGIRRGRFAVLAAPAFGQTETGNGYTGAYAPAAAPGAAPDRPIGGLLPEAVVTGPGLNIVGRDGVSTRTVRAVPCSTAAQETDGTTTCVGLQ
jgi:hypothetical protein